MSTPEPIPLWRRDARGALLKLVIGVTLLVWGLLQWLRARRLRAAASAWTDSEPAAEARDTTPST